MLWPTFVIPLQVWQRLMNMCWKFWFFWRLFFSF